MVENLGKLKHTTKQKCPDCGTNLQVRSRGKKEIGIGRYYEEEYLYCHICEEEYPLKRDIRRRREGGDGD